MRVIPCQLLALAASAILPLTVHAHSQPRNPIGALATVDNATIHTHNHRVTAVSNFDLSFVIRDDLHVKLRLEPNHNIFSEDAHISYLSADGTIRHVEAVERLDHKVFMGDAWVRRPSAGEHDWVMVGWARATVTRDGIRPHFEGAFDVRGDSHHILSAENYIRTRHDDDPWIEDSDDADSYMVLYRNSDILPAPILHQDLKRSIQDFETPSCQSDILSFNVQQDHPVLSDLCKRSTSRLGAMDFSSIFKRQIDGSGPTGGNTLTNLRENIGNSAGCPTTRKVALVGVATDCTYTGAFNSTQSARENVVQQINTASAIWERTFNISLGLRNLTVSDASCPGSPARATEWNQGCSGNVDIEQRLNLFSAWRGQQADTNSHWTLLSTCNTGSAIGLAWLGQACVNNAVNANSSVTGNGVSNSGSETVAGANVVIRTRGANEWQVIAHETGHTFGAVHDCTSQTCSQASNPNSRVQCCPLTADGACDAGSRYIMNPSASLNIDEFSMCSIGNVCGAMRRGSVSTSCLSNNRDVTTFNGQQCGNGIVEPGEDCDCGGAQGCGQNNCCDAATCKFKNNAVCDDSNEDCCRNCQFASSGTVCRPSTGQCDPQEVCTGNTPTCPRDVTTPDGDSCGSGLACASGQCTSRDQQCQVAMTAYTRNNDSSACDSQSCQISCKSSEFGPNVCYGPQQNYLDGTPCGGNGKCQNGQCKGSSAGGQISSWVNDHKAIVIGVCSAVGGLILLAILSCCISSCRRRRRMKRMPAPAPVPPPGGWQGWNSHPQMRNQNYYAHPSQGWANQQAPRSNAPPVPPPAYMQRQPSVRYA